MRPQFRNRQLWLVAKREQLRFVSYGAQCDAHLQRRRVRDHVREWLSFVQWAVREQFSSRHLREFVFPLPRRPSQFSAVV